MGFNSVALGLNSTARSLPWEQLNILLLSFYPLLSDHRPANGSVFSSQQEMLYESWTILLLISLKIYLEGRRIGPFPVLLDFPFCLRKQTVLQAFHFSWVDWYLFLFVLTAACLLHGSPQCWVLWGQKMVPSGGNKFNKERFAICKGKGHPITGHEGPRGEVEV
jgi:hypothetical protein